MLRYRSGGTNTATGIRSVREEQFTAANGDRPDNLAPDVIILITDGESSESGLDNEIQLTK